MGELIHEDTAALVIGGTEGVGQAIAARLIAEGCGRIVIAGRDAAKGEATAARLGARYMPVDLSDTDSVTSTPCCWRRGGTAPARPRTRCGPRSATAR